MNSLTAKALALSLLLLCSCATENLIRPRLPADMTMNKDAGRGNLLFVTLRMKSGEKLPFIVDTGTSHTLFDKSMESKLGKCIDRYKIRRWGVKEETALYAAPKLYSGSTPLMTASNIVTYDLKRLSSPAGPIMGILGMDCLEHYCIQLDFSAGKMRFLDDEHSDKQKWGRAFALTALGPNDARPSVRENLFGAKGPGSLIDTGCNYDGWLASKLFRQWTNHAKLPANGETRSPNGVIGGETYPDLHLTKDPGIQVSEEDVERNGIGLRFLARHLVTLDFPKQTMYLRRASIGPLVDKDMEAGMIMLKHIRYNP